MTATTDIEPGLDLSAALAEAPTSHQGILDFVREAAELCTPDRIHWCTGSEEEWTELTDALVESGTFTRLDPEKKPNSFHCASDPTDVARVEDRTFICRWTRRTAGPPTTGWTRTR